MQHCDLQTFASFPHPNLIQCSYGVWLSSANFTKQLSWSFVSVSTRNALHFPRSVRFGVSTFDVSLQIPPWINMNEECLGLLECVDHFVQSLDIRNKRFNIIFHYGNETLQISWFCYRWIALGVPRDITNKWKLFGLFFLILLYESGICTSSFVVWKFDS